MTRTDPARLLEPHRRQAAAAVQDLRVAGWGPPFRPAQRSGGTGILWVRIAGIYDDIDPPNVIKHPQFGRGLNVVRQRLVFPPPPEPGNPPADLSWEDAGAGGEFAFPDPIVLAALDAVRADPEGLGEAIPLDDDYEVDPIYKALTALGRWIVVREPFAILGGPEYSEP